MPRRHRVNTAMAAVLSAAVLTAGCADDSGLAADETNNTAAGSSQAIIPETAPPFSADEVPDTTPSVEAAFESTTTVESSGPTESTVATTTSAPDATVAATSPPPTTTPAACRRLTDFDDANGDWFVVNDGVMGGRSNGLVEFAESTMRFTGNVVTQGGGFTSVRLQLRGDELAGTDRILMRVRADDRVYALTLADAGASRGRSISHGADLTIAAPVDGWSIASVEFDELDTTVFGQSVDAAPFEPDEAAEFGIIIADATDGDFALEVDWIDACA